MPKALALFVILILFLTNQMFQMKKHATHKSARYLIVFKQYFKFVLTLRNLTP